MVNKKKISIVIPTYNEEKNLPFCLDALLAIDYPKKNFEVIIVDNGSTDNTKEIAKNYGAQVLRNDLKNVSGLRNLGVTKSSGEIIAFLDADCIVANGWLYAAEKYFYDSTIVLWGSAPIPPRESTWVQNTWHLVRQKEKTVQDVDWLESMNLFVRKQQFLVISGFNEALVTCEDVDFSYRMKKYGRIVSDNKIKVIHLGEAATINEFMKKEIWRGKSNLNGIFSHDVVLKEIPSLAIPLYFGIFLPIFLSLSIILQNQKWLISFLLFYLLPTFIALLKIKKKRRKKNINLVDLLKLLVLMQVYFFARTVAVFKLVKYRGKESRKTI